jgi:hypothetical protein
MRTIPMQAALEQLQKDFDSRSALLDGVPEICPISGNPKRAVLEQMLTNTMLMAKNGLMLPMGALEAGDTLASSVPTSIAQVLPIIAASYPDEVAYDLVMNLPMDRPTGQVMWLVEKYGTADSDGDPDTISVGSRMDVYKDKDYSTQAAEGDDAAKVSIDLLSATTDTKAKVLKAHVTPQAMQDWPAVVGVDPTAAINTAIANALRREVGLEIIYQLVTNAGAGNVNWSSAAPAGSDVVNTLAHQSTLWDAVVDAQTLIHEATYKMPNFLISSRTNIARFIKIARDRFEVNPALAGNPQLMQGRYLAGTTESGMRIYVDSWWPASQSTKMLVGYKGTSWQEAGAFYAPYVPLWWTAPWNDPDDGGKWKRFAMTRYHKVASKGTSDRAVVGTMILEPNYYATITVSAS